MPKFSFPIPGRKSHRPTKEMERHTQHAPKIAVSPTVSTSSGMSKAQRFFGTDSDLNIDSPTRDDDSWMVPSSRSSVMSISISESTQLTGQTEDMRSVRGENKSDTESGVLPSRPRLETKASSTILGARYGEANPSLTDATIRLRNEDSSSTLKSFYDKHNSPLAISQQTSESSSRDLALRKGLPKVVPTSPLLHVQSVESMFLDSIIGEQLDKANGKVPKKKKPARLDLSLLFPSPGRRTSKAVNYSTSPMVSGDTVMSSPIGVQSTPNKLRKVFSKESMRSQRSVASSKHLSSSASYHAPILQPLPQSRNGPSALQRSPMDQIPEHLIPERRSTLKPQQRALQLEVGENERPKSATRKQVFESPETDYTSPSRPWNESSAASVSSQNTRSSNRTANSALSHVDLQKKSILSLSDSEDENDDLGSLLTPPSSSTDKVSRLLNGTIPANDMSPVNGGKHSSIQQSDRIIPRRLSTKMRKTLDQFPAIPESSLQYARQNGHRARASTESAELVAEKSTSEPVLSEYVYDTQSRASQLLAVPTHVRQSVSSRKEMHKTSTSQKRHARTSSQTSQRSTQQPTPPLSPSSVEFKVHPDDSNRFMAVTKQEEALLAALRMKRAKMKEEQDSVHRSPPRTAEEIRAARYSNVTYHNSMGSNKETVLMYLDTPITEAQRIYTAEPSPDLTDFLGFVSDDEDSTPRNSWKQPRTPGAPRPDSTIGPYPRLERLNTPTSSAARLSAVGVVDDYSDAKSARSPRSTSSRKKANSVRFFKDAKAGSNGGSDDGVVWGL